VISHVVMKNVAIGSEVSVLVTLDATTQFVVVRLCEFTLRKVPGHLMRLQRAC